MSSNNDLPELHSPPFADPDDAVRVDRPLMQTLPFVFASPHSGRDYPESFLDISRLDSLTLRSSEDAFVDEIMQAVPGYGAPLIQALFPRVYLDANRSAFEFDPAMFSDRLPSYAITRNARIAAGLGTMAKVVANLEHIYARRLPFAVAEQRVTTCHRPYHRELSALIDETFEQFGICVLFDCHSMPSNAATPSRRNARTPDIILGDRHGTTCAPIITEYFERAFSSLGYLVQRNVPYAGGYTTKNYGNPASGIHTLQIEINRALYLDEVRVERLPHMYELVENMERVIATCDGLATLLNPIRQAAE